MRNRLAVWICIIGVTAYGTFRLERAGCFSGDSLNKLVQSESIRQSGFASEELYYPGRALDPEYRFYPFSGVYHLVVGGKHLGQYPVALTLPTAVVLQALKPGSLFVLGAAFFLLLVFLFDRFAAPHPLLLLFVGIGTPILTLSVDYSEHVYFALINFAGFSLYVRGLSRMETETAGSRELGSMFLGGCLIGAGMFLRLESLFFFASLAAGTAIAFLLSRKPLAAIRPVSALVAGFSLVAGAFFVFNWIHYGHALGPRFMANAGLFSVTPMQRIQQTIILLFGAKFQLGFFGYMPVFLALFVLLALPRYYSALGTAGKSVYWAMLGYIPAVALASPGEGVVNWGPRFLLLAVLPCAYLLSSFVKSAALPRALLYAGGALAALSVVFTFAGMKFQKTACHQLALYQAEFKAANADAWIFSDPLLASYMGPEYFTRKSFLVTDQASAKELAERLRKSDLRRVAYIDSIIPEEWRKALEAARGETKPSLLPVFQSALKQGAEVKGEHTLSTLFEIR